MKITEWTSIISCFISFVELVVIGILTFAAFKMNTDYNNWQRQVVQNTSSYRRIVLCCRFR